MPIEAFIFGFVGSLHCVTMCGPLAMAVNKLGGTNSHVNRGLYNIGRMFTYSFLGLLAGLFGAVINIAEYQSPLTILVGIFLILTGIGYFFQKQLTLNFISRWISQIKSYFSYFLKKRTRTANFTLGVLNGLLPCGLVYMALATSLIEDTIWGSVRFMAIFGLGTFPAMLFTMNFIRLFNKSVSFNRIAPILISLVGILLILRGMGLGIPYVSPDISNHHPMSDAVMCN